MSEAGADAVTAGPVPPGQAGVDAAAGGHAAPEHTVVIGEITRSGARLVGTLATLTDPDVRTRLARLTEAATSMPAEAWDNRVTALAGWPHPAWYTLHRCWRELETHHVDLDVGYRTTDWPAAYVTWALGDTCAALAARGFPLARAVAVDLGRSWTPSPAGVAVAGPGHALLGWLSGRSTGAPLTADCPLPDPPAWPLPPAHGWT
ncbi:hypothetical protein ABT294_43305 [Nonomuraea sp. NPDC000554]|uniref:hypothetical protein n=1 Tax=Nonomuraea sp. NPDC000554 TaxID=3154259 RepID=UPI0033306168